jgi:hypothetical protein
MGWLWRQNDRQPTTARSARKPQTRRLEVESLEERLVMSWGSVPPSAIRPPTAPGQVLLNERGDAQATASIARNEVDYYSLTAPRTGSYRIAASTPGSNLNPVLGVFNAQGRRVAANNDISRTNKDSALTFKLRAGDRYYLGITNYNRTPGGRYVASVDGPTLPDDRYEQNDTLAQAVNLGAVTTRRTLTNLALMDQVDLYRMELPERGLNSDRVTIRFDRTQGDLNLRLLDARGYSRRIGIADGGNVEQIILSGELSGTYYIEARL